MWCCIPQGPARRRHQTLEGCRGDWPLPAGVVSAVLLLRRRSQRRQASAQKAQLEMAGAVTPPEPGLGFPREPAWTSPPAVKMCDRTGGILESAVDLQDSAIKERGPHPKLPGQDTLQAAPEGDFAHSVHIGKKVPEAGLPGPGALYAVWKAVQKQAVGA